MKTFRFAFVGVCVLVLAHRTDGAANDKVFRAGAVAQDITPTHFPISVNGGMTDRQATDAHDRLHARCLVLDDGTTRLAIVVCDSCMIPREIMDTAKALAERTTGIPASHILISATHTHTAPTAGGVFQSDPNPEYVQYLPQQIAKGIQRADAQREPAKIGWAVGSDPTQVFNRRWSLKPGTMPENPWGKFDQVKMNPGAGNKNLVKPAGPIDPEIPIVSVVARDGRPIALLANYSLHYVGGWPALSADYFGAFAERVKKLIGAEDVKPAFVGIMSNGTSGDINNINFASPSAPPPSGVSKIEVVADSVAQAAVAALKTVEYHDWVALKVAEREIELGVRLPSASDVVEAEAIIAKAKAPVMKGLSEVYARETVLLSKYPPTVKMKLQAMRIGDLGIVSSPCETFVEIGLAIKKNSPLKPTFTIELANGYNGYLPTPEQHALGGYETWRARSSYLETGASPKIYATLMQLLDEVADAKTRK
ncbi:MAG TPA: hypothetical protein VHV77_13200 [Pirellulales bacterium]|nr:hypothetical protein [Pirellulales bacterium]